MSDRDRDQLTDLQARNTELVEENRRLVARCREIKGEAILEAEQTPQSPAAMVREFMDKYNQPRADKPTLMDEKVRILRWTLLDEECSEYFDAELKYDYDGDRIWKYDLVAIADALADMVYVIYGTAETYGIPLDRVIAEVHRSNMTKTSAGEGKKVAKGPDYQPPRIKEILEGE